MLHVVLGVLIISFGVAMVVKSESFYRSFGTISFFERYFQTSGGGRLGYKILGMMITFLGIIVLTDLFGGFMGWLLGPLIRAGRQ